MNNLYRELAPITEAAWTEIEQEATRTFKRHIAGRRVVDVSDPGGPVTAAVSTGHLRDVAPPADPREMPDIISQALSELRLAGVDGPYSVLLSADVYTQVSETTVNGYPIREHLNRLVDGEIIWAPAIDGAFVLSTRGGDFDLQLGTDVSIGYLSHDADTVQLYLQETMTFLCYTAEASVALSP